MDAKKLSAELHEQESPSKDYELKESKTEVKTAVDYFNSLELKLTEEEELKIAEQITKLADEYLGKMKDWHKEWEDVRKWYEDELPEKDIPWIGASQHNEPIIFGDVNAVGARIDAAIWGRSPTEVFIPTQAAKIESVKRKENFIEYAHKNEMNLKEEYFLARHDAVLLGIGFLDGSWERKIERIKDVEKYNGLSDLSKFLLNYPDAEKKYPDYIKKLKQNQEVEFIVSYDEVVYDAPRFEWFTPEDGIFDPEVRLLKRQICSGRRIHLNSNELLEKEKEGFFKNVDKIYTDDMRKSDKPLKEPGDILKVIFRYDFNDDGIKENCLFWVQVEKKVILKAMAYPYWHNKPFIVPFFYEKQGKKGGFVRRGLGYRLRGMNRTINALIQQSVDSGALCNMPIFSIKDDADFNPNFQGVYPGAILPFGENVKQMDIKQPGLPNAITLAQWIKRSKEEISITSNMTGNESPSDPSAPAAKTKALLFESNYKVSQGIEVVQGSMREIFFLISELYYQFIPEKKEFRILGKTTGEKAFDTITREDLRIRGDFMPLGSMETNPEVNFNKARFLFEALGAVQEIRTNPVAWHELVKNLIMSTGEYWEKIADKIAPDPEVAMQQIAEFKQKMMAIAFETRKKEYIAKAVQEGKSPQEAQRMIESVMGGMPDTLNPENMAGEMNENPE